MSAQNVLLIPEITAKVFQHLNFYNIITTVPYVCKTWRAEARMWLFLNRSEIIYKSVSWQLNDLRINGTGIIIVGSRYKYFLNIGIAKIEKFKQTFNLDYQEEFEVIRKQLRQNFQRLKRRSQRKNKALAKCNPEDDQTESNLMWAQQEARYYGDLRFEAYKRLVNFEFFLTRHRGYKYSDKEKKKIHARLRPLYEREQERLQQRNAEWSLAHLSANDLLGNYQEDYWGDENPDA
jgi:hypothetical protein